MYDAIKQLGITPAVVTTGLCFGTPMTQHLDDVGERRCARRLVLRRLRLQLLHPGSIRACDLPDQGIEEYGQANGIGRRVHRLRRTELGNVLTIAKFINEIGAGQ